MHRDQFDYAIGGPFWRDRLCWFSDYQGTRQVAGASTGLIQVMTNAERGGVFRPSDLSGSVQGAYWAQALSQRLGYPVANGEAYSSVFPGGVIPQSAFDPVAVKELKYIPIANVDPVAGTFSNNSTKKSVNDTNFGERVDFHNRKTGDWVFYYHYDDSAAVNALGGQAYVGSAPVPGFPTTQPALNQMFMLSDTKTIGPSMVNVARATFFRTAVHTAQPSSSSNVNLSSLGFNTDAGTLGIVPSGPAGYAQSVPPDNFNNLSLGNNWLNLFQVDKNYMADDTVSKTMGSDSLSFGGEFRYYQLNIRNICGPNGYFVFNGIETGVDYADFLIGAPAQYVQCTEQFLNNRSRYGGIFGGGTPGR